MPVRAAAVERPPTFKVAMVRTGEMAQAAVEYLQSLPKASTVFACDTETTGVDPTEESPVGKGRVICFSVFSESADFTKIAGFQQDRDVIEVKDKLLEDDAEPKAQEEKKVAQKKREGLEKTSEGEKEELLAAAAAPTRRRQRRKVSHLWVDTNGAEKVSFLTMHGLPALSA